MSALIQEMIAATAGKAADESVSVQVSDLRTVLAQASAREQIIFIYEQLLAHAAEVTASGVPNPDLTNAIVQALATR